MNQKLKVENDDFSLEVKKWNARTKMMAQLATEAICESQGISIRRETSYLGPVSTKKVKPSHSSVALKRAPTGRFMPMFSKEDLISKVAHIPIYKPILEHIRENMKKEATTTEVAKLIKDFYDKKLNKKIELHTAETYATNYMTHMDATKEVRKLKVHTIIKEDKKSKKGKPENLSERIYKLALTKNWIGRKDVPLEDISIELNEEVETIKSALIPLFKIKKAAQQSNDKVRF